MHKVLNKNDEVVIGGVKMRMLSSSAVDAEVVVEEKPKAMPKPVAKAAPKVEAKKKKT